MIKMKLLYRVLPVPSTTGKKKAHPLRRIGFQGKLLYRDRLFVHAETSCAEAWPDRRLPSFQRVSGGAGGSQELHGPAHAAAAGGSEGNHGLAGEIGALQKGLDDAGRLIPPDGILKCSPSSPALENTGLNGLHKCVFCSFLVAYCSDLSYLHCTLAHLFIQIPMFNAFPYVLRMIRDSGCLIRCLYVFSYILFFTGFEIHSGFSC